MIQLFHCFGDGYSYYPIVADLLDTYEDLMTKTSDNEGSSGSKVALTLPPPSPVLDVVKVLEQRLFDSLDCRTESMDRYSLRGNIWNYSGSGYSHRVHIVDDALSTLQSASARYEVPFDYLLLGLIVVSVARAGSEEGVEMTLYVPMRDGLEVSAVGMFADWRDIIVSTPKVCGTVLGTVIQVADIIRNRRWSVFSALRKPERTFVNFNLLDPQRRASFQQLGDVLWQGGDQLSSGGEGDWRLRHSGLDWISQPLSFNISQQDKLTWAIYARMDYQLYPTSWTRRFAKAFEDAAWDFISNPAEMVHKPYPQDFW